MGQTLIKLGQINIDAYVAAGTYSDGSSNFHWWIPSKYTGLSPQGGEAQLFGWATNTQYMSGLKSGLVAQAEKLGDDFASRIQSQHKRLIIDHPTIYFGSLKNIQSGMRYGRGGLSAADKGFRSLYGLNYGVFVNVDVSGLAKTDENNVTAYIDPTSITGFLRGPYITGTLVTYSIYNTSADTIKIFLSDGTVKSGILANGQLY